MRRKEAQEESQRAEAGDGEGESSLGVTLEQAAVDVAARAAALYARIDSPKEMVLNPALRSGTPVIDLSVLDAKTAAWLIRELDPKVSLGTHIDSRTLPRVGALLAVVPLEAIDKRLAWLEMMRGSGALSPGLSPAPYPPQIPLLGLPRRSPGALAVKDTGTAVETAVVPLFRCPALPPAVPGGVAAISRDPLTCYRSDVAHLLRLFLEDRRTEIGVEEIQALQSTMRECRDIEAVRTALQTFVKLHVDTPDSHFGELIGA